MKAITGRFFTCILTAAMFISLTACSDANDITLDTFFGANTASVVFENHFSVEQELLYYEELNDQATFRTTYCYYNDGEEDPVYTAEGRDMVNAASENNFKYCILNDMEYYFSYNDIVTLYPLSSDYSEHVNVNSTNTHTIAYETIRSVEKDKNELTVTSIASSTDIYSKATLSGLESLCGDELTDIKYVYTADRETMLLKSIKTYLISAGGTEYLFSEENITYDVEKPSTDYASIYIEPNIPRTVTVIEKTDSGNITNTYTVPAACTVDFKSFTEFRNCKIFNDENGLEPFVQEVSSPDGYFPDAVFYAIPYDTASEADESITDDGMGVD